MLRISAEGELEGLDIHEHGAPAYHPEPSYDGYSPIPAGVGTRRHAPGVPAGVEHQERTSYIAPCSQGHVVTRGPDFGPGLSSCLPAPPPEFVSKAVRERVSLVNSLS